MSIEHAALVLMGTLVFLFVSAVAVEQRRRAAEPFTPTAIDFHIGRVRVTRHACPMTAELLASVLLPLAVLIDNSTASARGIA